MVNLFKGRRKSSGNILEEVDVEKVTSPEPIAAPSGGGGGGFKVLSQVEIAAKKELAIKKQQEKPKFGRFSGFGGTGNKSRQQSMDDESPGSSKRDSKSSSGTQFSTNRPYHVGQFGSTSTLPSSADTDPHDNMFANLPPRPLATQHNSSPSLSMAGFKKALPQIPHARTHDVSTRYYTHADEPVSPNMGSGRSRAMTTSSYASTAIPPKLDSDLNFGGGFDDLFSGLDKRRDSPDFMNDAPGRSLLAGKRAGQPEPIHIDRKLDVEPPLRSWDSRGSGDNLISSPTDDRDDNSPPPPVPLHKYAPVASHSPDLSGSRQFQDADANVVRKSAMSRKSVHEQSPERNPYTSSSSATSLQTPLSSRTGSNNTTPKAALRAPISPASDGEDDNMFAPSHAKEPYRKPALPVHKENIPPPPTVSGDPTRKVMTAAEFQALKARQQSHPADDSSDSEDYEDEEDAIRQREEEELKMRKKQQQMQIAREALKRSTTVPLEGGRPDSFAGGMGFPSEASLQADQWDDEDVPLGMLAQHLPAKQNIGLTQSPNPSYHFNPTVNLPDRPASAGATSNRQSQAYRPVFARNLPEDPYASPFVGGGLVRQQAREPMGFNRAASVYGEPVGGSMPYADATSPYPTLVGQIQMRESSKQKYNGGASSKTPNEGPFTGALGAQMNGMNQSSTRIPQMPQQGMMMNPMMNMMGGGMMGMGQMPFMQDPSMMQNPQMQQYHQLLMAQSQMLAQMQAQQAGMFGQQMAPDPRMSMYGQQMPGFQGQGYANGSMPNLGNGLQNRPMSIMSGIGPLHQQQQQGRPFTATNPIGMPGGGQFGQHLGPGPGYTASIAPSERSNIGMSSRYRPVTTGNGVGDHMSSVSSQTLQASVGASEAKKVKGILKNKSAPQVAVRDDDEDDWSKMRARKSNDHLGTCVIWDEQALKDTKKKCKKQRQLRFRDDLRRSIHRILFFRFGIGSEVRIRQQMVHSSAYTWQVDRKERKKKKAEEQQEDEENEEAGEQEQKQKQG